MILFFLIVGLVLTALSFSRKRFSSADIKLAAINHAHTSININRAATARLECLPGIGPILAQEIVTHREKLGIFKELEELKEVKGIGEKKFEKIKDLITIGE